MTKTVIETEFKFYSTYQDALNNSPNYILDIVDVEGGSPPDQVWSKKLSAFYSLRSFSRCNGVDRFFEQVYLKI